MGYTIPKTRANSSFKASSRVFWFEQWSSVMSFPYGTSCYNRSTMNSLMAVGTGRSLRSRFKFWVICEHVLWLSQTGKRHVGSWQGFRMTHGHTWAVGTCKAIYTSWMVRSNVLGVESLPLSHVLLKALYASWLGEMENVSLCFWMWVRVAGSSVSSLYPSQEQHLDTNWCTTCLCLLSSMFSNMALMTGHENKIWKIAFKWTEWMQSVCNFRLVF